MRILGRRALHGLVAVLATVAVVLWATDRPRDAALFPPRANTPTVEITLVSHGWHTGLVLATADIERLIDPFRDTSLATVLALYPDAAYLEIGWGDEGFYRGVPTISDLTFVEALRALFRPGNPSVLHVVPLRTDPRTEFPFSDVLSLVVAEEGARRLLAGIEAEAMPGPIDAGEGLYGGGRFFRARSTFHLFNVCNTWVGRRLGEAGVPSNPVVGIHPLGFLFDLERRAGAVRLLP